MSALRLTACLIATILTAFLTGCKPVANTWPAATPHRYMNGLRSHSWILPDNWQSNTALIDSLAAYDFMSLGDLANTSYPAFAESLRTRKPHPLIYAAYTFNRIWDYPNDNVPGRPVPAISQRVYDRLYPLHIAHIASPGSVHPEFGDTAIATWANSAAEYVINWADPAVPELLSDILADYILTANFRPDGLWLDWQEYPGSGWWLLNGPGSVVDGDRDGVTGIADVDERNITYINWLSFTQLMHKKLGENFFIFANAGSLGPLDATSTIGSSLHTLAGLNGVMYEHFPFGWGGVDFNSDYVQRAFEYDNKVRAGYDSYRQYLKPPHTPTFRQRASTPSGGYVFLDQILLPNFPYVAILSLYCDGAVANAGPFRSHADEWAYFESGPQPHYWHGDEMNDLKALGFAVGEPYYTSDNTWKRDFDYGYVELRWNPAAILPLAPTGNIQHPNNPGGPFDYQVVIDDTVRYSHLWR